MIQKTQYTKNNGKTVKKNSKKSKDVKEEKPVKGEDPKGEK